MNTDNKAPREFWIVETIEGIDEGHLEAAYSPFTLISSNEITYHLIEKSAYDQVVAERDELLSLINDRLSSFDVLSEGHKKLTVENAVLQARWAKWLKMSVELAEGNIDIHSAYEAALAQAKGLRKMLASVMRLAEAWDILNISSVVPKTLDNETRPNDSLAALAIIQCIQSLAEI